MTDGASPAPRRALPATDERPEAPARARRALPPEDPPPAPVLPPSHWAPSSAASAGRHFSADDLPDDWRPARPRRSASSPAGWASSPASPAAEAAPVLAIPAPAAPTSPAPAPPGTTAAAPAPALAAPASAPVRRLPRWALPTVGGLAAVALIATVAVLGRPQPQAPASAGTTPAAPGVLAEATELARLIPGAAWAATDDLAPDEARGLRCALPVAQQAVKPVAGSLQRRTFTSTSGAGATVVQQVERYASAEDAQRGYAARLAQLGGCAATPDLVRQGLGVSGLGERAGGVLVTEQSASATPHDLLVVQAGSLVTLVDAQAGASAPDPQALAQGFAPAVGRACGAASGSACAAAPTVAAAPLPPAGEPAGFLAAGDLPLVTAGTGAWVGAQIKPMRLAGSGCEGIDLTAPPTGTPAGQQAFVLTGDPKASAHFGLDEVVYTFAGPAQAKAFVDTIVANISACSKKQPAARATSPGKLPGGYGQLFTIELRTTLDKVALSRVLVAASGSRAVYVAANPTAQFDLPDASWLAVLQRAVSRATQLP